MSSFLTNTRTTMLTVAVISAVAAFAVVDALPSAAAFPATMTVAAAPAISAEASETSAHGQDCAKKVRVIYAGYGEGCSVERL